MVFKKILIIIYVVVKTLISKFTSTWTHNVILLMTINYINYIIIILSKNCQVLDLHNSHPHNTRQVRHWCPIGEGGVRKSTQRGQDDCLSSWLGKDRSDVPV